MRLRPHLQAAAADQACLTAHLCAQVYKDAINASNLLMNEVFGDICGQPDLDKVTRRACTLHSFAIKPPLRR